MSLSFGEFELDQERRQLLRSGAPVPLERKAYELLCLLVERRPHALSRGQIRDVVWPGVFVSESALPVLVNAIRQALDDDARQPRFIRTVHGFGYAFCGEAREDAKVELALASSSTPAPRHRSGKWLRVTRLAILAVAAAFVLSRHALRPKDPDLQSTPLEAAPLTAYPGHEREPTFSPDGSLVAFTWDGEGQDNQYIYVKAIGAEQPLRLTSDGAPDGSPAWSPDGTRIAFLREKPNGGSEVRIIGPTGGPERQLGEVQGLAHQGLTWSPDGRSLAVVDRPSPGEPLGIFVLDTASGLKKRLTVPERELGARQVTRGGGFAALESADGRYMYFTKQLSGTFDPQNTIWRTPVAGGDEEVVVESYRSSSGSWDLTAEGILRGPGSLPLEDAMGGTAPTLRSASCDRGGPAEVSAFPCRACRQRFFRRSLSALHAEPGRIRPDAGREPPLTI
jgi:DNA-binding winged helix-turn-helix (wHTH) protein